MTKTLSLKMKYRSSHFNLNQRVFILYETGDQAALCYGRFRGRFRWVKAWVRWDSPKHPFPTIQEFEVDDNCHIAKELCRV